MKRPVGFVADLKSILQGTNADEQSPSCRLQYTIQPRLMPLALASQQNVAMTNTGDASVSQNFIAVTDHILPDRFDCVCRGLRR